MPPRPNHESISLRPGDRRLQHESGTRKIPARPELGQPELETYEKTLLEAEEVVERVMRDKAGQLAWYQTEWEVLSRLAENTPIEEGAEAWYEHRRKQVGGAEAARPQFRDMEAEMRETEVDLRRAERRARILEQIKGELTEGRFDKEWYKEERAKRDLRSMIKRAFGSKEISATIRKNYGVELCAVLFAAHLNDELLSEYPITDKTRLRNMVNGAVKALPEKVDAAIEECLRWALQEGYLALPVRRRGVLVEPPPVSTIEPPRLVKLWKKVAAEAATYDRHATTALPARPQAAIRPGAGSPRKKVELKVGQKAEEVAAELHEGDTLAIHGIRGGTAKDARLVGIKNIREEGGKILLEGQLLAEGEQDGPIYKARINLESAGSTYLYPIESNRLPSMYFMTAKFEIER